jgi:antitoxin (DNA-binding transcriptional repressor) of toxin-antitoxin stability system
MLSVSITELAERSDDIVAELRAGHSLELIQGGKRFAEITPAEPQPSDEERKAAWAGVLELMESGLDLGGVPLTRDEMHER